MSVQTAMTSPRVAIVHGAQTQHKPRKETLNVAEMLDGPVRRLLKETQLTHKDIETVITCSSDFLDGRTISDMAVQEVTGSIGKSASKVSNDGAFALIYAWMRLLSGEFKTSLVTAHSKCSEGNQALIENAAFDPLLMRKLGLTNLAASALQARAMLGAAGASGRGKFNERDFALAACHNLAAAAKNANAHNGGTYTPEQIKASPLLCEPIHALQAAPYSDGAGCLLLATEDWLREHHWKKPVAWLTGLGYATEEHYLGDKNLAENRALRKAAQEAYRRANIKDAQEINCLEISAPFSHQIPLWLEELGCLKNTSFEKHLQTGRLNRSGGLMGAMPGFASGLIRVIEAARQLQEAPGSVGLAHGVNGFPGQSHCVWVMKSEALA